MGGARKIFLAALGGGFLLFLPAGCAPKAHLGRPGPLEELCFAMPAGPIDPCPPLPNELAPPAVPDALDWDDAEAFRARFPSIQDDHTQGDPTQADLRWVVFLSDPPAIYVPPPWAKHLTFRPSPRLPNAPAASPLTVRFIFSTFMPGRWVSGFSSLLAPGDLEDYPGKDDVRVIVVHDGRGDWPAFRFQPPTSVCHWIAPLPPDGVRIARDWPWWVYVDTWDDVAEAPEMAGTERAREQLAAMARTAADPRVRVLALTNLAEWVDNLHRDLFVRCAADSDPAVAATAQAALAAARRAWLIRIARFPHAGVCFSQAGRDWWGGFSDRRRSALP